MSDVPPRTAGKIVFVGFATALVGLAIGAFSAVAGFHGNFVLPTIVLNPEAALLANWLNVDGPSYFAFVAIATAAIYAGVGMAVTVSSRRRLVTVCAIAIHCACAAYITYLAWKIGTL